MSRIPAPGIPASDTEDATVPVTAEWALWGKTANDTEDYRLLDWSNGTLGSGTFSEAINRYAPGVLGNLPQVTVSWLKADPEHNRPSYVAMAIHHAGPRLSDASNRLIEYTSYYCVPYDQLAQGAVSYQAMYAEFAGHQLKVGERKTITTRLPRFSGRPASASADLAGHVAGLLLTGDSICVLDADLPGQVESRLGFLDSVMSLLPYGMRSMLSASTWVSSTAARNYFRLAFSSAPPRGMRRQVFRDRPAPPAVDHAYARTYYHWLADKAEPYAALARMTKPVGFRPVQIKAMLDSLYALPSESGTPEVPVIQADLPPADPPLHEPETWEAPRRALHPDVPTAPERPSDAADFLSEIAERLSEKPPGILPLIQLEDICEHRAPGGDRQRFRQIIEDRGLLRADMPVNEAERRRYYDLLLRLAIEPPLTYLDYCWLEECAGTAPHRALLAAIDQEWVADLRVRLLVLNGLCNGAPTDPVRSLRLAPAEMLAAAADSGLRTDHARIVCDVVITDLMERLPELDRTALRDDLRGHGYLAATLPRAYLARNQLESLADLLGFAHGEHLDGRAVVEILENPGHEPTALLYAAVLELVDRENRVLIELAERSFSRGLFGYHTEFGANKRDRLLRMLPPRELAPPSAGANPDPTDLHAVIGRLTEVRNPERRWLSRIWRRISKPRSARHGFSQGPNWLKTIGIIVGALLAGFGFVEILLNYAYRSH